MIGAGLGLYAGWSGGTAIGVVAGDSLGDPATLGLDAAFPALFLALLAPLLLSREALAAALLGAGIALALTPLTPAGIPVIAATAGCLAGLRRPAALARTSGRGPRMSSPGRRWWWLARRPSLIKAAGPVLAGGRELPQASAGVVDLLGARPARGAGGDAGVRAPTRRSCSTSAAPAWPLPGSRAPAGAAAAWLSWWPP